MPKRRRNPIYGLPLPAGARRLLRGVRLTLGAAASLSIAQQVQAAANAYGVDPNLALAVAQRESSLNPNLVNPSSGAAGVMQLMPATAAQFGVTDPLDPAQNINAGVQYLAQLLQQYNGNTAMALAAYNWGPSNVNAAVASQGDNWLSVAPSETQNYVAALTGETPGATTTINAVTRQVEEGISQVPSLVQAGLGPIDLTDPTTLLAIGGAALLAWILAGILGA